MYSFFHKILGFLFLFFYKRISFNAKTGSIIGISTPKLIRNKHWISFSKCDAGWWIVQLRCITPTVPSARAEMTLPKAERDLLMFLASSNTAPSAPVLLTCSQKHQIRASAATNEVNMNKELIKSQILLWVLKWNQLRITVKNVCEWV